MKFDKLVASIQNTHDGLQRAAIKAVNKSLTVRNWLIGLYIVEFEQKGKIGRSMASAYSLNLLHPLK